MLLKKSNSNSNSDAWKIIHKDLVYNDNCLGYIQLLLFRDFKVFLKIKTYDNIHANKPCLYMTSSFDITPCTQNTY